MKQIHKTLFTAGLLFGFLMLTLAAWATPVFAKPAFAKPAVAKSGNKVTGHYIREITPEIALEMSFSAHEAVTNKKGKTRPAKGYAMGYRISPDIPGEPLFWIMAVTCTKVFDENYARFAGVVTNHANPDRIGKPIAFEAFDYAQPLNTPRHFVTVIQTLHL